MADGGNNAPPMNACLHLNTFIRHLSRRLTSDIYSDTLETIVVVVVVVVARYQSRDKSQ